jgi:hypothetical protein
MNRGTLATLRDLVPNRPLRHVESLRIAEFQAERLLKINGITEGPVPASIITEIPKIKLKRMSPFPVSGCTDWAKGTWVIVINGSEPIVRQRFTLAHEFKHILDYRYIDIAYPTTPVLSHRQRTEVVCDFFAGCLLVPGPWLKKAWGDGMQKLPDLARTFGASQGAIQTRLLQTGLIDRPQRCADPLSGFRFKRPSSPGQALEHLKAGFYPQTETVNAAL